jgi:alkylhydroperoxidase family enzyme
MPQIWHLFAYKPDRTDFLAHFTQGVMRGPSPLSAGLRELIAALTSKRNDCDF